MAKIPIGDTIIKKVAGKEELKMKTVKTAAQDHQTMQNKQEKTLVDRMIDYMAKTEKKDRAAS